MTLAAASWRPVSPAVVSAKMRRPCNPPSATSSPMAPQAAASAVFCSATPRPRIAVPRGVSTSVAEKGSSILAAGWVIAYPTNMIERWPSGWDIIGGMAGYPSFATAAFFGLGAYAGALVQLKGVPMPLAWLFGALVPGTLALVIGWVVLRLRGHYFTIASLAVAIVLRELATNWTGLTG